jgi:hypothetical protein
MHARQDVPELVRFWSEHSGWDAVDERQWSMRFVEAPLGPAAIVLARDATTDEMRGQLAFFPSALHVRGHGEVTALRAFAPVLKRGTRGKLRVVEGMYEHAIDALAERKDACVYAFPDRLWRLLLNRYEGLLCNSYPTYSRRVPLERPFVVPSAFTLGSVRRWDTRVDQLWERARDLYDVAVVRDARAMSWKVGHGDFRVTSVERRGELVAVVAHREKAAGQWLICDLVAIDADALDAALRAAVNHAHAEALDKNRQRPITRIDVIATATLRPILDGLGFERVGYDFPIVIHRLSDALSDRDLAPDRWYVSAND